MNFSPTGPGLLSVRFPSLVAAILVATGAVSMACMPLRDLDATGRGSAVGAGSGGAASLGGSAGVPSQSGASGRSGSSGAGAGSGGSGSGGAQGEGGAAVAGAGGATSPGGGSSSGAAGHAEPLSDLPIEMNDSPVSGSVHVSSEASWQVNGRVEPAFQIDTPTATYFVVKKLGMVVSMVDKGGSLSRDWISYSDSYRPRRGMPNLGGCCQADALAVLTTTLHMDTMNPGHVRLNSSGDGWGLVWDFYRTHATLTVNRAPQLFSFGYRGAPGGMLDDAVRFVSSSGQSFPALSTVLDSKFSGPAQWAYLAADNVQHSLFLVQHGQDALRDHYSVDVDTSVVLFGAGDTLTFPLRFSFGLLDSAEKDLVAKRVQYVIDATPAQ